MRPAKAFPVRTVDITLTVPAGISRTTLRRWSQIARRRLPALRGSISVALVSPQVSRRLNRTYRGKDRPTNVLSFKHRPSQHEQQPGMSGEIILCPAVMRREARQQGLTYRPYVQYLLFHGFIHLLGLDHRTRTEQRRWQRWERRFTLSA